MGADHLINPHVATLGKHGLVRLHQRNVDVVNPLRRVQQRVAHCPEVAAGCPELVGIWSRSATQRAAHSKRAWMQQTQQRRLVEPVLQIL